MNCRRVDIRNLKFLCVLPLLLACGCATRPFAASRHFDFGRDTFAYANQLVWEYHYDPNGKWVHERREPKPDYTLHCVVLARSARQFFQNARFDPALPRTNDAAYGELIRRVVAIDPSRGLPDSQRIVIPGYANLREFSEAKEPLLKAECGSAWQSYFQRGNWRMIWPFTRASQKRTAEQLLADLKVNRPPVIHVVRFPQLTINHAMLVFDAKETDDAILFSVYDPNQPRNPGVLTFDRATRDFTFASNHYWPGGRVDVYEIYRGPLY